MCYAISVAMFTVTDCEISMVPAVSDAVTLPIIPPSEYIDALPVKHVPFEVEILIGVIAPHFIPFQPAKNPPGPTSDEQLMEPDA